MDSAGKGLGCRRTKACLQMDCNCCTNHSGNENTQPQPLVLAVTFQCWTAGKEEVWGLWLRACFITADPGELCKAMLKSRPDVPVHSLWGSRPKAGNPHDVSVHLVVPPGCRNFGQRKAWAGHRAVKLTGQSETEGFGSGMARSQIMKKRQRNLFPLAQGTGFGHSTDPR